MTFTGVPTVRLVPGVQKHTLPGGGLVLFLPGRPPLRVSDTVEPVWQSLVEGISPAELTLRFTELYPRAKKTPERVGDFLSKLLDAGLVVMPDGNMLKMSRASGTEIKVLSLEPVAALLSKIALRVPKMLFGAILSMAILYSFCAMSVLLWSSSRPRISESLNLASLPGILFILLLSVPLHELGHVIACSIVGTRVGYLCIQPGFPGLIRPFVQTPEVFMLPSRWARLGIAVGGPISDLLLAGAAATLLLRENGVSNLTPAFHLWFLYSVITLNVGTSPLQDGDGSNILGSLLNDPFVSKTAILGHVSRFAKKENILIYRGVAFCHGLASLCFLWYIR